MDLEYSLMQEQSMSDLKPKARKSRPIKLYTQTQWEELVKKVQKSRLKGWSLARIARNLNTTTYRVRQCLKLSGSYQTGKGIIKIDPKEQVRMKTQERKLQREAKEGKSPSLQPDHRKPILDLLKLIPEMEPETARYWLRAIANTI